MMQEALKAAMEWLSERPDTIFVGQAVGCAGTKLSRTFEGIPAEKRIEFPVAEELQLGTCIGLSLQGYTPICVFPRFNFMMRAMDQLVNHLDRLPLYSDYRPKVIIRVAVGSTVPINAGPQHSDDFTSALGLMLKTINVIRLNNPKEVLPLYKLAYGNAASRVSTVLVEC